MARLGLSQADERKQLGAFLPNLTELTLPAAKIKSSSALQVVLEVLLDSGYHLNTEAPSRARINIRGKDFDFHEELPVKQPQGNFTVALPQGLQDAEVNLDTTLYYCPDKSTTPAVCHIKSYRFSQPISLSAAGADLSGGASAITKPPIPD